MTNLTEDVQLAAVHDLRVAGKPRLGLSWLDQLAVGAFTTGDTRELIEHARGLAESLAGPDRDGSRLRLLSRAVAEARVHEQVLIALLADRLAKRDPGVDLVERVLRGVTKRLALLSEQHRVECSGGRRTVVMVGHADNVDVRPGR